MFRLVNSGYATPGLTGREQLDVTALDVLLDFAYGLLVENADTKQKDELDRTLAKLDAPRADKMVKVEKLDGTIIEISEARLAEIQSNVANIADMRYKKG